MGLGKTISALALMVSRPSSDRIKTNLIVGPIALLKQWEIEIKKVTLSNSLFLRASCLISSDSALEAPASGLRRVVYVFIFLFFFLFSSIFSSISVFPFSLPFFASPPCSLSPS